MLICVNPLAREASFPNIKKKEDREEGAPRHYDQIGKGALSLRTEIQEFPFPDLSGEVRFIASNNRPDASLYDKKIEIALRGCEDKLLISSGQKVYLAYDQEHLSFSKETTPLWINPRMNERGELWLEMGIEIISKEGEKLLNEKRETKVDVHWKAKNINEINDPELSRGIQFLQKGKWWAPDKLFECYGGQDFEKYKGSERLIFDEGILFLKEGKTAIWTGETWIASEETQGFPLAKVTTITPYKMEIELWDQTGLESVTLSLNRERPAAIALRMEEVLTRLRQRTASRISCRIDNRATILKEGDWLIKTKSTWHTVKHLSEIEAILEYKTIGDLFIFDKLEKVDGKEVFCGTLFDPTRTYVQHVRLPMTQIKGGEHSPPTKKGLSTRIQSSSSEEKSRNLSKSKLEPAQDYETFEE